MAKKQKQDMDLERMIKEFAAEQEAKSSDTIARKVEKFRERLTSEAYLQELELRSRLAAKREEFRTAKAELANRRAELQLLREEIKELRSKGKKRTKKTKAA